MRRLVSSEGVTIAALMILSFLGGVAVQYAFGQKVNVTAGLGKEVTVALEFGNVIAVAAIIAVGIGILGFLWTLSRDVSNLRERVARLEERNDKAIGEGR